MRQSVNVNRNAHKRRRGGLITVLLITVVCLIPIRLFVLRTYYVSRDACVSPEFTPGSLLLVRLTEQSNPGGSRVIFEYKDSLRRHQIAPAQTIEWRADSIVIRSCMDTLLIPRSAVRGRVISDIKIGL